MNKVSIYLLLNFSAEFDLICCLWWLTSVLCFVSFLTFRWEMLLTRLMYSSPKSPKSTTSSLVPSTACFVSLQPFMVLPDAFSPARIPPVFCFIFVPVQVYSPSWATAYCCWLRITSGRPWSRLSSSSSTSPSATWGWRSRCFLWRYHHLFLTGVSSLKDGWMFGPNQLHCVGFLATKDKFLVCPDFLKSKMGKT